MLPVVLRHAPMWNMVQLWRPRLHLLLALVLWLLALALVLLSAVLVALLVQRRWPYRKWRAHARDRSIGSARCELPLMCEY